MSDDVEYGCFIGNLSWSTTDRDLKEAFEKFGHLVEAKVTVSYLLSLVVIFIAYAFVLLVTCQCLL